MAYLDHAATTPMLPEALDAYVAAAGQLGNPSSLHAAGRGARRLVEESRERIAAVLGSRGAPPGPAHGHALVAPVRHALSGKYGGTGDGTAAANKRALAAW